jgi:hypothetical protein
MSMSATLSCRRSLERLGFITRIRRIRTIDTPLGFTTRQITNAYRLHEPASGFGLLASAGHNPPGGRS